MKLALFVLLPTSVYAAGGVFGYDPDDDFNPASWAAVDVPNNACGGSAQSGIDVPTGPCDAYEDYVFTPGSCTIDDMTFTLYGHAIQANYNTENCDPPRMEIPGELLPFEAVQFHIHTGTDHAIDGTYFGADFHLVHKEVGGDRFAVLGFFIEPTSPSGLPEFRDLLEEWEAVAASTLRQCGAPETPDIPVTNSTVSAQGGARRQLGDRKLPNTFNPYALMPEGSTIYTYDGSLTTPPCSEVVFWNVVDVPVSISIREFLRLTNLIIEYVDPESCEPASVAATSGFTGRPVQPINGRPIKHRCPTSMEVGAGDNFDSESPSSAASLSMVGTAAAMVAAALL